MSSNQRTVIIGAGPAGLSAVYELLKHTDVHPVIYEATDDIGDVAMTAVYKCTRIERGGHRFLSRSGRVMNWWFDFMPIAAQARSNNGSVRVSYQNKSTELNAATTGPNLDETDLVMLVRPRLSRIYYNRQFFDCPVSLNAQMIRNLGNLRMARIGISFLKAQVRQRALRHSLA